MTFAAALRSFLRQDPDIIMVGEIRDLETAEIAIKAAQTGHMVLSTLHTNDAPQTVARLMNMGIAPYNITVLGHAGDRPAPGAPPARLQEASSSCRAIGPARRGLHARTEIEQAHSSTKPVGCSDCNDGYKGRIGIYQVMPMTEEIQKIILSGGNALQIAEPPRASGVRDLRHPPC